MRTGRASRELLAPPLLLTTRLLPATDVPCKRTATYATRRGEGSIYRPGASYPAGVVRMHV